MPSVSILIAAYNEEETLRSVVERSLSVLRKHSDDYEVVVVNDASTDNTGEILAALKQEYPDHITAITHSENRGIAFTFEELYHAAQKEYFLLVPGDGQYPPELLDKCIPLIPDCDIVICRRVEKNYTPYRHLISSCYRWLPKILFGVDLYDSGSVKCMRRSIIDEVEVKSKSVFVEAERVIKATKKGYKIGVVDFTPVQRQAGKARGARLSTVFAAFADMIRLRLGM